MSGMTSDESTHGGHPPLSHVPAHLITGRSARAKLRLISHLQSLQPPGESWAVLLTDGADHLDGTSSPALHLASIRGSCICCSGSLELRTTLVRLLREARPQRV